MKHIIWLALLLLSASTLYAGTITGTVNKPNGQPLANGVISLSLSQSGVTQTGAITVTSDNVYCGTSSNGAVVGVTDPGLPAVLSANYMAGTLPSGTYYVEYTYTSASGESDDSPETTFVMSSNGTLNGLAPTVKPGNATGYKVYIGTTSGGETLQITSVGFAGWSQSTTLAGGAGPPTSNTTTCSPIYFNDAIVPSNTTYLINLLDAQGKQVAGYPQRYYLSGTTVDLSALAPAGNLYARFPFAIVAQPSGNALQSIAGPLSLGTYGLTAGASTFSGIVTYNALAIFNGGQQYTFLQSAALNPALTGFLRLADGDSICWRNHANGADVCISKNTSDQLVLPSILSPTLTTPTLTTPTITGNATLNGLLTTYNSVPTVSNGIASEIATIDITGQSAAIGTSTLYSVPSSGAGQYRLSWDAKVTTAAGTSSTLGPLNITYTDPDGTVVSINLAAENDAGAVNASGTTTNTTSSQLLGVGALLNCKASTLIQYSFAYASNAANAMHYNLHIKLESL